MRGNRAKYMAMRDALLPNLSQGLFPEGEKAGSWLKSVKLDLEAKGVIGRGGKGPVSLFRTER